MTTTEQTYDLRPYIARENTPGFDYQNGGRYGTMRDQLSPEFREIIDALMGKVGDITGEGELPAYAWPGGYPLFYLDADMSVLCAHCASESLVQWAETEMDADNGARGYVDRDIPRYGDVYYEGPTMYCEQCNLEIESAYGDPEGES